MKNVGLKFHVIKRILLTLY